MSEYQQTVDTKLPWLGEIPAHWNLASIRRTVHGCVNGIWGAEPDGENDITVLRVADFDRNQLNISDEKLTTRAITASERGNRLLKSGDLLIEKSGGGEKTLVGCVVVFEKEYDAVTSNFVAKMTPLSGYDSNFLNYVFAHLYSGNINYQSIKQTTGIQNIDSDSYLGTKVALPPYEEQVLIAAYLKSESTRIESLIAEKQNFIDLLKEKRQALISHFVTKGLDANVPMKDSGVEWIAEMPEHWEIKAIKRDTPIQRGASPRPIDDPIYFDEQGEYLWTRIADVTKSNGELWESKERLSALGASLSVKLEPESLFLSIAGTVGKPCISKVKACIHDGFVYFPKLNIESKFLYYVFDSGEPYKGLGKMGTQLNLNTETVGNIKIGVPPQSEQIAIVAELEKQLTQLNQLTTEVENSVNLLKEHRTALISAAVTGKIDVRGMVDTKGGAA